MKYLSLLLALSATACLGAQQGEPDDENGSPDDKQDPNVPGPACSPGRAYTTFGGEALGADRIQAEVGVDRRRVKSYAALGSEYRRIFGTVPSRFQSEEGSYGKFGETWFMEPAPSAVSVHLSYLIAFEGCLGLLQGGSYDSAPTEETATTECASLGRKFWSHDLSPEEISTCVTLATNGTASEPNPKRRWANVCAALASSSGFLTY